MLRDGKLFETPVGLGASNGVYQQVTDGLKAGDKVGLQYNTVMANPQMENREENPFMPKPPGSKKK